MSTIIFFVIIFIIITNVIIAVAKQSGRSSGRVNNRMWNDAAYAYRMNLIPPGDSSPFPSMRGLVNGIYTEIWGDFDENGFPIVFCRADYALTLPFRLCILKGGFQGEPVGEYFEIKNLSLPGVSISASDGSDLQKFLTMQNMNVLKNSLSIYHSVKVTDSFLVIGATGIHDGLTFCSFIERTVSAAKILSDGHTISGKSPVQPRIVPVPEDVPVPVSAPAEKVRPQAMIPVSEEEIFPEVMEPAAEKKIPEAIPVAIPVSAETPEVPNPEPVTPQEPESPAEETITVDFLTGQLFSNAFPGNKEKQLFQKYAGRRVCWSGVLKSVHPYSSDFVFGKGPGVKAVFEICEISSGYSMKKKVKATVSFSNETLPLLKGQNGKEFIFSGNLLKFEPFAAEILLEKGTLGE